MQSLFLENGEQSQKELTRMYDGMKIYKAIVTASSSSSGSVYVSIPSALGANISISVSTIGRSAVNGVWKVPAVGDQVVVAVEDDKFSNVYLMYPIDTSFEIADGSITTTKIANDAITTDKIVNNAVTTAKIANGSVTTDKLGFSIPSVNPTTLKVRRVSSQSIPGLTATMVSFDTEDSDSSGLVTVPSTTITIPTGMGGTYALSSKVTRVSGSSAIGVSFRVSNTQNLFEVAPGSSVVWAGGEVYLVDGDTIQLRIESNSTVSVTAILWMRRIID